MTANAMRQPRTVWAVAELSDASETTALRKHVDELQEALAQAMRGICSRLGFEIFYVATETFGHTL